MHSHNPQKLAEAKYYFIPLALTKFNFQAKLSGFFAIF